MKESAPMRIAIALVFVALAVGSAGPAANRRRELI